MYTHTHTKSRNEKASPLVTSHWQVPYREAWWFQLRVVLEPHLISPSHGHASSPAAGVVHGQWLTCLLSLKIDCPHHSHSTSHLQHPAVSDWHRRCQWTHSMLSGLLWDQASAELQLNPYSCSVLSSTLHDGFFDPRYVSLEYSPSKSGHLIISP